MIKGRPAFNGLALMDLTLDAKVSGILRISARFAYVNTEKGTTHGSVPREGPWSPETLEAAARFLKLLERDAAAAHLDGVASDGDTPGARPGLSFFLGDKNQGL